MAGLINYIFKFANQGQAVIDPVVGPFFAPGQNFNNDLLVYQNDKDSVTPLSGYWCMVGQVGPVNPAFANHPNIQIVNDRTLQLQRQISVLQSALGDLSNTEIIVSPFAPYCIGLLAPAPPVPPPPPITVLSDDNTGVILSDDNTGAVLVPG